MLPFHGGREPFETDSAAFRHKHLSFQQLREKKLLHGGFRAEILLQPGLQLLPLHPGQDRILPVKLSDHLLRMIRDLLPV